MKISLNLVKQLTRVKLGNEELLKRIHSRLAEVEGVENLADKYQGVVVADVKKAAPHPNADKLGVYMVDNGTKVVQVVAGDKTLKVGDKVAHILPGLVVPSTFYDEQPVVLKKVNLRGEDSNGMLGSAKELDFGEEHGGVLKLDTKKPAGTTLINAYDLDDQIVDIDNKTLTHRPDCFGLIGFAREVAGIQDLQFKSPAWMTKEIKTAKNSGSLKLGVVNEVKKDSPTYLVAAVSGIEVKDSPVQLMTYLNRLGVRPINNIVDITNYYMVMTGQPLHAFDYDKVANGKITVRYPKKGEKLKLLDGKEITIRAKAVTISDNNGAIALGGVMGGANSEITGKTKNIIIECANFDMYSVRHTSMKHGIFSDAATRFMRGQSPAMCKRVLSELLRHTEDIGGGTVASDIVGNVAPEKTTTVAVDFNEINALLGADTAKDEQKRRLENVEIEVTGNKIIVPYWRRDLHIWQDIAEEVGRLAGFDNILATVPDRSIRAVDLGDLDKLKNNIRSLLASSGANEVLTYSGVSSNLLKGVGLGTKNLYQIRNSLSSELEYMRASVLPSLLAKVHPNHKRGIGEFAIYEIAKTHSKKQVKQKLPVEQERLALVFSANDKVANEKYEGSPYYQARKFLDYLLRELGISGVKYEPIVKSVWSDTNTVLSEKRSASIFVGKTFVGAVGEFKTTPKRNLKLRNFSAGFELDICELLKLANISGNYRRLSRFPGSEHDVTFETLNEVTHETLREKFGGNIESGDVVTSLVPLGAYRKKDDSPARNISFRVSLVNVTKTMSAEEINRIVDSAVSTTEKELKVKRV